MPTFASPSTRYNGHTGKALLDGAIAEKGLDQALADLGEKGVAIREDLHSTDFMTYLSAMVKLFFIYLNDSHNSFGSGVEMLYSESIMSYPESYNAVYREVLTRMYSSPFTVRYFMNDTLARSQREAAWGDANYRECGSTAIIRLDEFMLDEAAWVRYCGGEGDMPEDSFGIVVDGLRRASENPEIENVLFDMTCNSGGYSDMIAALLAVTTGQDKLYGIHWLTGRRMTLTFETDVNYDGVFDERDKAARYDFNYGALVTRLAFSAGNSFPILLREGGAVIIGEPSDGGSCSIQVGTGADGLRYAFSSAQWQFTDSRGMDSEGGCGVDLPIKPESNYIVDVFGSLIGAYDGVPDFTVYYDDARLDEMMNAWFADQDKARAA